MRYKANLSQTTSPNEVIELSNRILFWQTLQVLEEILVLELKQMPVSGVLERLLPE